MNNVNPTHDPETDRQAAEDIARAEAAVIMATVTVNQTADAVYAAKAAHSRAELELDRAIRTRDTALAFYNALNPRAAINR